MKAASHVVNFACATADVILMNCERGAPMKQLGGMDANFLNMETAVDLRARVVDDDLRAPPGHRWRRSRDHQAGDPLADRSARAVSAAGSSPCRSASTSRTGSRTPTSTSTTTCGTTRCRRPARPNSSPRWSTGSSPARSTAAVPLWELYVIEGVENGKYIAQLNKIHHATIDGAAGVLMLGVMLDEDPDSVPGEIADRGVAGRMRSRRRATC